MNFTTINKAIIDTLGNAAAGRFHVIGFEGQAHAASEIRNNKRTVQSFYSRGDFSLSGGRFIGPTAHKMTFIIGCQVSAAAKADLAAINAPNASPAAIAAALATLQEAAHVADTLMDELFTLVYQILMDANNLDLNLPIGTVSSRWIESIEKSDPVDRGSLVVLNGTIKYVCQTSEDIVGEVGVPVQSGSIFTQVDIAGDDTERTGVEV